MGEDLALCFVILAMAIVVAWPIWSLDETLAAAYGRLTGRQVTAKLKRYAASREIDYSRLCGLFANMKSAAAFNDVHLSDLEVFWAVKAAFALSSTAAIPVHEAIRKIADDL